MVRESSQGEGIMGFVHLHNHTEYSTLDGITRLKDMARRAWELGMPACAITDHGYMKGCAQFYLDAISAGSPDGRTGPEYGIKPILGCEAYFTPDDTLSRARKPDLYHLILLAKDNVGYVNLMQIMSTSAVANFYYKPRTTLQQLRDHHEGIIATSACMAGIIPRCLRAGDRDAAVRWARTFASIFGPDDFYIELQNQFVTTEEGMTQDELNALLDGVAREVGVGTVATNDFHYLLREDAPTQDLMLCIGTGSTLDDPGRMRFRGDEYYMKTEEEMRAALGPRYQEACDATVEIARRCGARPDGVLDERAGVFLDFDHVVLPRYPGLDEGQTHESQLRRECERGLARRYGEGWRRERPDVADRFEYEYRVICEKGFAAYFLIVQDYVSWAKRNGIGVGPGRGSAAGSLVSYALDITTLDPIENGLMFERFLSPERTEMPDIDIDFDDERRLEVVDYVRRRYGADHVAHIITYSVLKAKAAIRDAARVLGYPVGMADRLTKMVSGAFDVTLAATMGLDEAHREYFSPDFVEAYRGDADARRIIDAARSIEGLTRGEGVHACAVLICRDPVNEHVPTKLDTKQEFEITQYEGHMVASMGLLKMDFLGLRTLTVISKALANVEATTGERIDVDAIPLDDPQVYELLGSGRTAGVFQVESAGMTATIKSMRPTEYKHIVALIALYRPGPLGAGMVTDYVERMHGRKRVTYYDDRLADILGETYGTIVYQEQVMQISMRMSGFSAGESDKVRKAVAKKKVKLMTETIQRWEDGKEETMQDHWMNGAVRNGYPRQTAERVWSDVMKFASYAFNKSHSAGYAILVLQTAWLKAHYPREYMAAVLTSYNGKTDKIVHYVTACRSDGIDVLIPDVNQSGDDFTPVRQGIRFGLAGIRGVGEGVSALIVAERAARGPYRDIFDFVGRVDLTKVNRRVIESLVRAGAFDSTGYTRRQLSWLVAKDNPSNIVDSATRDQRTQAAGQLSMFDLFEDDGDAGSAEERVEPDGVEWDRGLLLAKEREVLGIYVSDHPLRLYERALERERDYPISAIGEEDPAVPGLFRVPEGRVLRWAGMVSDARKRVTRGGEQMATFTLEDMEGRVECVCFPRVFARQGSLLFGEGASGDAGEGQGEEVPGEVLVRVCASLERSDRGSKLNVSSIERLRLGAGDGPRAL
jgi:DNA polymerase-3 subunit alpha